ncbi:Latent glucokinase ycfX [Candidatus Rhodobacter oscarellae]|uniref:N-acetylglucosamine kinase n=1 Tax=Candidatus Rhodobacter oscarellae TaxID=1675527 RepID=A0A0J9EGC2_9RHOB|nr:ROK family protein [Candidatus Rhodobacter lobularis]KMW60714.1 Latent glucokinase ycfX [Candidatus Rhodobacter lobularis]
MIFGGIDLGGSKIEARLFNGPEARTMDVRRVATPTDSYDSLLDQLSAQIDWLIAQTKDPEMPIGIAVPGILSPDTGVLIAANLVASGLTPGKDIQDRFGRSFTFANDCMAFALSEANGGAAEAHDTVLGLILGTGLGGGICVNKKLAPRHGGIAVEIGHAALPASAIARHQLPLWECGCGRLGCMETCVSGTGLSNIAHHLLGKRVNAETIWAGGYQACLDIWADITGECLMTLQTTLAPDCIVLGGGMSNAPGIAELLRGALSRHMLEGMALPDIVVAQHGDSSGARGAALLACQP